MNSQITKNRQILLASRPRGEPSEENFKLVEIEIPKPAPPHSLPFYWPVPLSRSL
jgi:NADPH-dependent curcumin reductase CurA